MREFQRKTQEERFRTARDLNLQRKRMQCLGCEKTILTNRCQRFCRTCTRRLRRNGYYTPKISKMTPD